MIGTLLNVVAILIGGALGLFFGARLPQRLHQTVVAGLGLFVLAVGVQMFIKTENAVLVLASLLVGGVIGELLRIEDGMRSIGVWLEARFGGQEPDAANPEKPGDVKQGSRFVRGFLTASLVFIIGPMAILGSIQDGLTGDYNLLAIKSILDGFASLAFASTLGIGVLFSSLMILVYQGGISLAASQLQSLISPAMMTEMTAVGGVMLMGIALSSLLEIKPIRVGSFLPALVIAPVLVWLF